MLKLVGGKLEHDTVAWIFHFQFELLLCVEDESDPAIMLARSLMKKYPNVDSRLFTGGASVGVNPKINNMYPAYMAAKYDMLLISDSGIRSKFI
uniref:Ceramide glucosyltransferase n=1 Tax=Timema monikensis TaxID=170555 RepID=A0A7R9EEJ0_9NEOP|nr:unnamed protein product [Timema monikensis]